MRQATLPDACRAGVREACRQGDRPIELIPAVDLLGARVVRLKEGDFGRATDYGDDPTAVVGRWVGEGASRLHLVDLDGARAGRPVQAELIGRLARAAAVPCQVAGGLRDDAVVDEALAAGADRVVLGSGLLADPGWAAELVRHHGPARIVAALDVRDDRAVGEGWTAGAQESDLLDIASRLASAGVGTFVVTAIARDGLMTGPDLELLEQVARIVTPAAIIASGGIASLDDLRELAERGYAGAILGRALYEGRIDLRAALAAVS
jgi:phosphoribosylformimino-5-aminoimidazole carboxamide ribotide isomerase